MDQILLFYKLNCAGMKDPLANKIYTRSCNLIEVFNEFLRFAMVKVTVHLMMWPMCIYSYFTYFTTDLGQNAFELPFYAW